MKRSLIVASLCLFAVPALAETPSYDFVQLGYQSISIDDGGFDIDGDGIAGGVSFSVADNWHIFAGLGRADFDFDLTLTELDIGLGYHTDTSATTSFFADLAYVSANAEAFGIEADENGFGASIGFRSNVSDTVELEGALSYVDLGDGADGLAVGGAAWYRFANGFALGANASFEEDATSFGVAGRYYFGR